MKRKPKSTKEVSLSLLTKSHGSPHSGWLIKCCQWKLCSFTVSQGKHSRDPGKVGCIIVSVKVVSNMDCERIHKEKKRQRAKFYSLSKREMGHGIERCQQQNIGALNFYWIIIGL